MFDLPVDHFDRTSRKQPAVFLIHFRNIKYNKEIDGPEFAIHHRRAAYPCADSKVHIEECRKPDLIRAAVFFDQAKTVSARRNCECSVDVASSGQVSEHSPSYAEFVREN